MRRREIEDDLPLIEFYLDEVLADLASRQTHAATKVQLREVIATFARTRNIPETADVLGVSTSRVYQLLAKSVYAARRRAGLWPGPPDEDD